jgi:hypothetical protein
MRRFFYIDTLPPPSDIFVITPFLVLFFPSEPPTSEVTWSLPGRHRASPHPSDKGDRNCRLFLPLGVGSTIRRRTCPDGGATPRVLPSVEWHTGMRKAARGAVESGCVDSPVHRLDQEFGVGVSDRKNCRGYDKNVCRRWKDVNVKKRLMIES